MHISTSIRMFENNSAENTFLDMISRERPHWCGRQNYTSNNGEINCMSVDISRMQLGHIPIKFGHVNGEFNCSGNRLSSFEFLPDECSSYKLEGNPGYNGILKHVFDVSYTAKNTEFPKKFIRHCLNLDVWHDGETNEYAMSEALSNLMMDEYSKNKQFFKSAFIDLLTEDDSEILCDMFGVKKKAGWVLQCVKKSISQFKESSQPESYNYFEIMFKLLFDIGSRYSEKICKEYDMEILLRNKDAIPKMSMSEIKSFIPMIKARLNRDKETIKRDEECDLFVFIGFPSFEETKDGLYKKSLGIENLVKIDLYNMQDLQMIEMMRIRAATQGGLNKGSASVYKIWMPKGALDENKTNFSPREIPSYLLDLIDKYKERI